MFNHPWTHAEKKVARRAFDAALQREFAAALAEFRRRAAQAHDIDDLWQIEAWLRATRREIDQTYDYRYSQLLVVFALLLRAQRLELDELAGLSEDKLATIRRIASL